MSIRKKGEASSSIAHATRESVTVRGLDLCEELIGRTSFTEYFLLLLTGSRPSPKLARLTDACLVAIAEHGMVGSVQVARMTLSSAPDALQGAVAAGLLGCGPVILGAAETAGVLLGAIVADQRSSGKPLTQVVTTHLERVRDSREAMPGFGHPIHKDGDPRAARLLALAVEIEASGEHCAAFLEIDRQLESVFERRLPMNVSGAIPAVLLDAGFPIDAMRGIPLVARSAGLVAHLAEERVNPIGRILSEAGHNAIAYVEASSVATPTSHS